MLNMHRTACESRQMHFSVTSYVTRLVLDLHKRNRRITLEYFLGYASLKHIIS
jgi:hypothetical protein